MLNVAGMVKVCSGIRSSQSNLLWKFIGRVFLVITVLHFALIGEAQTNLRIPVAPEAVELGYIESTTGNLHLEIPLGSYPQRGSLGVHDLHLEYDSAIWAAVPTTQSNGLPATIWSPSGGFTRLTGAGLWSVYPTAFSGAIGFQNNGCTFFNWNWTDYDGVTHFFPISTVTTNSSTCAFNPADAFATDSTGLHLYVTSPNGNGAITATIYAPDGTILVQQPAPTDVNGHMVAIEDTNGNYLSYGDSSHLLPAFDTAGRSMGANFPAVIPTSQGTASYVSTTATINLQTNFGQSGVEECNASNSCSTVVVTKIALPDGTSYTFQYDCDSSTGNSACSSPGGQSAYYGVLTKMTLPSGGQITYTYKPFLDVYGNASLWVSSRTAASGTWTYVPTVITSCSKNQVGCIEHFSVVRPSGDTTVYSFTVNNGAWPTQIQRFDSANNVLATINKTWDFSNTCPLQNCTGAAYIRQLSEATTIPVASGNSLTRQVAYSYDSPQSGRVTAIQEWNYLSGASPTFPATPDRAAYTVYQTNPTYTAKNMVGLPVSVTLCNNSGSDPNCPGGGSKVKQTQYTYDSYGQNGLSLVSGVWNHDDANFGAGTLTRGNPTSVQEWVSGSTYLTTQLAYDTTGQVTQVTDPAGNIFQYSYNDNFFTETGVNPPPAFTPPHPTNAYLTSATLPLIGTQKLGYFYGSGKQALFTDPNGSTTYSHFQDPLDRLTETVFPIGWDLTQYTSATQVDAYLGIGDSSPSTSCTSCKHSQQVFDGLGRKTLDSVINNPAGSISVNTSYDPNGRIQSVSHPYISTSAVLESWAYDGLDRVLNVTHPDQNTVQSVYGSAVSSAGGLSSQQGSTATYGFGYPVLIVDEAGKQKQEWINAFGNVIEVDEPGSSVPGVQATGSLTIAGSLNSVPGSNGQPATPGSGSVSITGTEQSVTNPATPGSGRVTISGSLQSKQVSHPATSGVGSVTVSGAEQVGQKCVRTCINVFDTGTISITVNGHTDSSTYGQGDTQNSVATKLANAINSDGAAVVTASVSNSVVNLTAKTVGASTDYSLSAAAASTNTVVHFLQPSFPLTPSGSTLTGGNNANTTTLYDSGTGTITVNGHSDTISWSGSSTTGASIAAALASSINADTASAVSASASGSTVTLTAKTTGPGTDYSLSSGMTFDSTDFSSPTFSSANSGQALTGGNNSVTTNDSGTITVTVNGTATSVSYGSSSTTSSLASALASALSSGSLVNATASGANVTLTSKATGASTNYSLAVSSASGNPSVFNPPSFGMSDSGSSLTGGSNAVPGTTIFDSGTLTVSVAGFTVGGIPYGSSSNSTASQVATAVAAALGEPGSPVTVKSVSGATLSLAYDTMGTNGNVSITVTPTSSNSSQFPNGSFASSGSLSGGVNPVPLSLSNPYVTLYQYDALGNLIHVAQGAQTRSFAYDGLSRATTLTTPEAGTLTVAYATTGGALCSGDSGNMCSLTDARGITTTYTYDALDRLTGKTYSDGTGAVSYSYDQGGATAFALGLRTGMTDSSGSETYTYDAGGRMTQLQKTVAGTKYTLGYQYNAADELTSITYPSGRVVQQSFDVIGNLCEVAPQTTGCGTSTSPYATAYSYDASGNVTGFNFGNGVVASYTFSPDRAQLSTLSYKKGAQTLFSLNYLYKTDSTNCPNGASGNNGQIQCILDNVDSGRTVNFAYDGLGRVNSAMTNGSTNFPKWGLAWNFDQYGNRLSQALLFGSGFQGSLSFANPGGAQTNRPDGFSFDPAGNLLNDGNNALTFDAENRAISVKNSQAGASTYGYDGAGLRVTKASGGTNTVTIFSGSADIAEYDNGAAPSAPSREFIYSNDQLVATIAGGVTTYQHSDHLSVRLTTDVNGNMAGEQGHYPFGELWYSANATSQFVFTSYQRDNESGLDYALARFYSSGMGRFCSVDPVGGDPGDPQSWNRYTYTRNDPVNLIDPSGRSFLSSLLEFLGFIATAFFAPPALPAEGAILPEELPLFATFAGATASQFRENSSLETTQQGATGPPLSQFTQNSGTPSGYTACPPTPFIVTGVGPRQAPDKAAGNAPPPRNGQVAINPKNYGLSPAEAHAIYRGEKPGLLFQVDWDNAQIIDHGKTRPPNPNKGETSVPQGLPVDKDQNLSPGDTIGGVNRNSNVNRIDLYRYEKQRDAWRATRRINVTVLIPYGSKAHCPK